MGTKQKVSSIKEKLHKLEKQLEKIQKICSHKNSSVKFVNQLKGARWVCEDCQHVIRVPTKKEVQTWIDK